MPDLPPVSPDRADLLADVATRICALGPNPLRVAVDGYPQSGKTTFARELAAAIRHHGRPAAVTTAQAAFANSPPAGDTVLVADGTGHRAGEPWDYRIWLTIDRSTILTRILDREQPRIGLAAAKAAAKARLNGPDLAGPGLTGPGWNTRDNQADLVIANSNPAAPRIRRDYPAPWPGPDRAGPTRLLTLEVHPGRGANYRPDYPAVRILIDGHDTLRQASGRAYGGPDPDQLFGPASPLLPASPARRIAVYGCCCGIWGCGSVAPLITEHDGRIVWHDFRDYTGLYDEPVAKHAPRPHSGNPLPFPAVAFDPAQYRAEVERASADLSWQTPDRQTADELSRQLQEAAQEILARHGLAVEHAWSDTEPATFGITLAVPSTRPGQGGYHLLLTAPDGPPPERAAQMIRVILDGTPETWPLYPD